MLNRRPKPLALTLEGVSRVSFVLAPARALSPRLVRSDTCAEENDNKTMQMTSRVKQKLRAGVKPKIERSIREAALEPAFSTCCDTKWRIALLPPKYDGQRSTPHRYA